MTFAEDSSSMSERPSLWSDWGRRYFQKRYLCSWILTALVPFILLRLVFISEITFPFQTTSSSPISLQSEEYISQEESPDSGPDAESKPPESTAFIRPDEDAWITHDDWINNDLNPRDDKRKDHQVLPSGNVNRTEFMKPFSSMTDENDFGLPEDNEKDELELEASEMNPKDEKKFDEDPTAAEETTAEERNKSEAKDRFEAGSVQQGKSEEEEKVHDRDEIHTDENRNVEGQERADEQGESEERSAKDEDEAAQNREAEVKRNFEEEQHEREAAKEKEARVAGDSEESRVDEQSKAEQNGHEEPKLSEEKMQGEEQPKPEVMNPSEEQHEPEEKVDKEKEKLHQDKNRTDEEMPTGECNLFEGAWEHDPEGPLYTNSTCFYIQEAQNCMSNGRPDIEYMYWRWKPRGCDLPRFDAKSFLDLFRGKAIGFIGDSIARNQMQSLLCLLSQVEIPIMTYVSADDQTVRWLFKEYRVTLAVVWSPYLLKVSKEGVMGFEKGQSVLYLDELDTSWISVMADFDIMVFLTGQWFYKSSVYVKRGEVVGCHYCPSFNLTEIGFYQAYRGAIREVLEKVSNEYKGIAIMSTFPLSHFENGTWDTGGYCKRELPLEPLEGKIFPGEHNKMRETVVEEFNRVVNENREMKKDSRLEILDVTRVSLQRADGHPGPFRRPNPFEGRHPDVYYPNDCLHWCLPGPIEAWNQLVAKIVEKYL